MALNLCFRHRILAVDKNFRLKKLFSKKDINWYYTVKTSRERPKSAPYLRLKNSKRTSKYSLLRYRKNPKVEPNWHTRGDTLKFFIHSVANHQKNWRGTFGEKKFFKSHNAEKSERGFQHPLWGFQHPFCRKTPKKLKGDPLGKLFFEKKSHRAENTLSSFGPFEFLKVKTRVFKVFYLNLLRIVRF